MSESINKIKYIQTEDFWFAIFSKDCPCVKLNYLFFFFFLKKKNAGYISLQLFALCLDALSCGSDSKICISKLL